MATDKRTKKELIVALASAHAALRKAEAERDEARSEADAAQAALKSVVPQGPGRRPPKPQAPAWAKRGRRR